MLSNAQGELSALERGMHALGATEKGKHGKSIAAYAKAVGRAQQSIQNEVCGARVAGSYPSTGNFAELANKCMHLVAIHAAPEACWPALVYRMVKQEWTVERTSGQ